MARAKTIDLGVLWAAQLPSCGLYSDFNDFNSARFWRLWRGVAVNATTRLAVQER